MTEKEKIEYLMTMIAQMKADMKSLRNRVTDLERKTQPVMALARRYYEHA